MSKLAAQVAAAKRQLQVEGYTAFIRALSVNNLDWRLERLMADVRKELNIAQEQHLEIVEKVMSEPAGAAIREGKLPPKPKEPPVPHGLPIEAPHAPHAPPAGGKGKKRKMEAPPPMVAAPAPPQLAAPPPALPPTPHSAKQPKKGKKGAAAPPAPLVEPVAPPVMAPLAPGLNKWIGRVVERMWGGRWHQAVVTDFNPTTGMHAVTYELNTPNESFEWYSCEKGLRSEFRPTNRAIDLKLLMARSMPGGPVRAAPGEQARPDPREDQPIAPARGGGKKKSAVTPKAPARPDDKEHEYYNKVASASMEELGRMAAQLHNEEARILAEMVELGDTDDEEGEEAALARLTAEWQKLSRRESEIRAELSALESS